MAEVLRISLVTETWPPEINGVAMTLGRLVDGLAARGHRVEVVRPRQDHEGRTAPASACGRVTHRLRPGTAIPRYQGLRMGAPSGDHLARAWGAQPPDVVHVATEGPLGFSALAAARRLGLPVTSSYHTNFHDYAKHYRIGPLARLVHGYLRGFHAATRATLVPSADLIETLRGAGWRDLALWARGVDTRLFSPEKRSAALRTRLGAGPDDLVCLHVGRVAPEKDIPLALRAFAAIRARQPGTRMAVVGGGPLLERLRREHPDAVFTGPLPVAEVAEHYASADLFLFPSLSETFGNVLMEAMASGTPAVAYDYAAARMHLRHRINGLAIPCGDEATFISAAVAAAADHALRARLGAAARATAEGVAWDAVVDRFASLLTDASRRAA
jgi:glycosyltransferase involved in cell wall biosynthesis